MTGVDTHMVVTPNGASPVPFPFTGTLAGGVSEDVLIDGLPAAVVGSVALNNPPHPPPPPPASFLKWPSNQGRVAQGSAQVLIGGKPSARAGDTVTTCNDPVDMPTATIAGGSPSVLVG